VTAFPPPAEGLLAFALSTLAVGTFSWERIRALTHRPDTYGDSRWAGGRDLRGLAARPSDVDGAVLGWHGNTVLRLPDEDNLLMFGVQRSGKTSTVVVPTLLHWPGAALATSTKDELVQLTGRHRALQSAVRVFAPLDTDVEWVTALGLEPVAWNPISDVASAGGAAELADVLTAEGKASRSPHWYLSAANLLTALFLVAQSRGGDVALVLRLLNATPLFAYGGLGDEAGGRAVEILHGFAATPPDEAGSIISTARAALSLWLDDRVVAATAAAGALPHLDLDRLLSAGETLYLVAPAEDAERCRSLFTALIGALLRKATSRARSTGGVLIPRLLLALDEAANFARVPRLASYVSTGPGQGIQSLLCYHDLAQLRSSYGPDAAATIWNNCRARLLLPGQADPSTLELFSRALGTETVVDTVKSWSRSHTQTSQSHHGRPLRSVDQLRRSEAPILVYGTARPARLTLRRWDQVPEWKALVDRARAPSAV